MHAEGASLTHIRYQCGDRCQSEFSLPAEEDNERPQRYSLDAVSHDRTSFLEGPETGPSCLPDYERKIAVYDSSPTNIFPFRVVWMATRSLHAYKSQSPYRSDRRSMLYRVPNQTLRSRLCISLVS